MTLIAYNLDLAILPSEKHAAFNALPNGEGIITSDGAFIPSLDVTSRTTTISKGIGKFDGYFFELDEDMTIEWGVGVENPRTFLAIDLAEQNEFTGSIEEGTYKFVDHQSSIVLATEAPVSSEDYLVFELLEAKHNVSAQRAPRWQPNTRYRVGDTFIVESPEMTVNESRITVGKYAPALFLVEKDFTSGTSFPASDSDVSNNYRMMNTSEGYFAQSDGGWSLEFGIGVWSKRTGNFVNLSLYHNRQSGGMGDPGGGWQTANEKVPSLYIPIDVVHFNIYKDRSESGAMRHRINGYGQINYWVPAGGANAGTWWDGSTFYLAGQPMYWPSFNPIVNS